MISLSLSLSLCTYFVISLIAKPDVTLTIGDGDLVDLMTGKLNAQKAFFQGKLKIQVTSRKPSLDFYHYQYIGNFSLSFSKGQHGPGDEAAGVPEAGRRTYEGETVKIAALEIHRRTSLDQRQVSCRRATAGFFSAQKKTSGEIRISRQLL